MLLEHDPFFFVHTVLCIAARSGKASTVSFLMFFRGALPGVCLMPGVSPQIRRAADLFLHAGGARRMRNSLFFRSAQSRSCTGSCSPGFAGWRACRPLFLSVVLHVFLEGSVVVRMPQERPNSLAALPPRTFSRTEAGMPSSPARLLYILRACRWERMG